MKMKKTFKSNIELLKTIRNTWTINPRTRVAENEKNNIKKIRQENKKKERNYSDE